jgi:hypothetical protein
VRPAFYALAPGSLRDYVTLLHPPYTAWHLSYVVIGGCLASTVSWSRLGWTVLAFALAVGIAAHALDELNGRPLRTSIPRSVLIGLAAISLATACAIGLYGAVTFSPWLIAFVLVGAVLVPAYSLELWGGRAHTDLSFALAWGGLPLLTGYFACSGELQGEAFIAAGWATALSLAQRRLSTPVRRLRRQVHSVHGYLELDDGARETLTRAGLLAPSEAALQLLAASTVAIAAALAVFRL